MMKFTFYAVEPPPPEDSEWDEPMPPTVERGESSKSRGPALTVLAPEGSTWLQRLWILIRIPFVYVFMGRFEL